MQTTRVGVVPIAGALIALAAVVVVGIPLIFTATVAAQDTALSGLLAGAVCATSGPISGLTDGQAQNARTIAAVAGARGGDRAAFIVVMTGLAESGLRALGNPNDPTAIGFVTDGVGTDHDSLGIFQQRPSWGPASQRLDAVAATNLFLDRLLARNDWAKQPPWVVAQTVQESAWDGDPRFENRFSTEVGGNYRAVGAEAARILTVIKKDAAKVHCSNTGGSGVGVPPGGPITAYGLPLTYVIPSGPNPLGRNAVSAALSVLGHPYVFGAVGPVEFDCSGLTQWAWSQAGVSLPHYTVDQWHSGVATDAAHLAVGDLVLTPGADGTLANPQHVGLFIGSGLVVEAPQTGDVVKVVTYDSFVSAGLSGLRHLG